MAATSGVRSSVSDARALGLFQELADLGGDDDGCARDFRRQRGAELERPSLDAVDEEPRRQAAERAAQLDGLGQPETVRGSTGGDWQRNVARVEPVDLTGQSTRQHCIDEHDRLGALAECLEQACGLPAPLDHVGCRQELAQVARHDEADRVVAAHGVSQADDAQAARRHARSTSSFRKCVAQEMHGS